MSFRVAQNEDNSEKSFYVRPSVRHMEYLESKHRLIKRPRNKTTKKDMKYAKRSKHDPNFAKQISKDTELTDFAENSKCNTSLDAKERMSRPVSRYVNFELDFEPVEKADEDLEIEMRVPKAAAPIGLKTSDDDDHSDKLDDDGLDDGALEASSESLKSSNKWTNRWEIKKRKIPSKILDGMESVRSRNSSSEKLLPVSTPEKTPGTTPNLLHQVEQPEVQIVYEISENEEVMKLEEEWIEKWVASYEILDEIESGRQLSDATLNTSNVEQSGKVSNISTAGNLQDSTDTGSVNCSMMSQANMLDNMQQNIAAVGMPFNSAQIDSNNIPAMINTGKCHSPYLLKKN